MAEDRYVRVGTTLYKIDNKPLISGEFYEVHLTWSFDLLSRDHTKEFISEIPKYSGFCLVPNHLEYKSVVGSFLNQYAKLEFEPKEGNFSNTVNFLSHFFGDQIEFGLDYIQLLYSRPIQKLPVILFVSKERGTGKTTFLNYLKLIFSKNMTYNTNDDFRSNFNEDWTSKLIVAIDEVLLDRREDSEKIKNLSTARIYKSEAKGKDRVEVEFFAKFILCSNNEERPIIIDEGEVRYWVRKISPLKLDDTSILTTLRKEIPAFLYFLKNRKLTTEETSRMWFDPKLLETEALHRIIRKNRNKEELELLDMLKQIFEDKDIDELNFCNNDVLYNLPCFGIKLNSSQVRNILTQKWLLKPSPNSNAYTTYRAENSDSFFEFKSKGRYFTLTKKQLLKM